MKSLKKLSRVLLRAATRRGAGVSGISRRITAVAIAMACLLASGETAVSQGSGRLEVRATVPPDMCQFPNPCTSAFPDMPSRATISNGDVYYLGTTPAVTRKEDLLVVLF